MLGSFADLPIHLSTRRSCDIYLDYLQNSTCKIQYKPLCKLLLKIDKNYVDMTTPFGRMLSPGNNSWSDKNQYASNYQLKKFKFNQNYAWYLADFLRVPGGSNCTNL